MSHTTAKQTLPQRKKARSIDFYRAVWRWHFYAGLLVLPFLILLAVTGGLYLFHTEIDDIVHRDLKTVEGSAGAPLPHAAIIDTALALHPGAVFKYTPPPTSTASAEVSIKTSAGDKLVVYVDPYRGRILGELPDRGTIVWTIRKLHSLQYFGPVASGMIEIAGGWTILLVITGMYLWWPRHRSDGGAVSVRGDPKQRVFWRDIHAVTGIFVGFFILFLAVTGMPWSVLWGAKVNQWANGHNFGYPAGVRVSLPMSDEHLNHVAPVSWSLEQARIPESASSGHGPIGLDAAIAIFDRLGLAQGYAVNLPGGPSGVYTGSVYPGNLPQQRVIHLDQFSGKPLIDMSYADYGPLGKGLEWGINVHVGQEFGLANRLVMLVVCIAIVLLCVSAAVMWWKRRPTGSLGVPPLPADRATLRIVFALLLIGGVIFPLVGASMLVMLVADTVFARRFNAPRTSGK
jgi:uncharacterized iron-regulated membrane protein